MRGVGLSRSCRWAAAAALVTLPLLVSGAPIVDTTQFTYDANLGPYQSGTYAPTVGAELVGGFARLRTRGMWDPAHDPNWYNEAGLEYDGWKYRIPVTVSNPNSVALAEYQVTVSFTPSHTDFWSAVGTSPAAIRFSDSDGVTRIDHWTESFDSAGKNALFWVKVPKVEAQATWTGFVYFGYAASVIMPIDRSNELAVFSYADKRKTAYVLSDVAANADMDATGFIKTNYFSVASFLPWESGNFDPGTVVTVPSLNIDPGSRVSPHGPISGGFNAIGTSTMLPMAFQGAQFVMVNDGPNENMNRQFFLAPHAAAEVTVYEGGLTNAVDTFTLNVDASTPRMPDVAVGNAEFIVAKAPVLVEHVTLDGRRGRPLVPPSSELFGVASTQAYVVVYEDNTRIDAYFSNNTAQTFILNQGEYKVFEFGGVTDAQGMAPAVHVVGTVNGSSRTALIAGHQARDGDGTSAVTMLPPQELSSSYYLPREAQYVSVATLDPKTTCSLMTGNLYVPTSAPPNQPNPQTSGTLARPFPNKIYFGWPAVLQRTGSSSKCQDFQAGQRIPAGSVLSCDRPVFAYYEDCVINGMMFDQPSDEERNLFTTKQNRQRAERSPSVSTGGIQTVYLAGDRQYVDSPTFRPAGGPYYGIAKLLSFAETASKPAGTALTYQLSGNGTDWRYWSGTAWVSTSGNLANANTAAEVTANVQAFDTSNNTLVLRAILASSSGLYSPRLDTAAFEYHPLEGLHHFSFDPVGSPQKAGTGFAVKMYARDVNNFLYTPFDGNSCNGSACTVFLSDLTGTVSPTQSGTFSKGVRSETATVCGVRDGDVITATYFGGMIETSGASGAFNVTAGSPSTISKLQGDTQTGAAGSLLPLSLRVLVKDSCGNAVPGAPATFGVTSSGLHGDARLDGAAGPVTKNTDAGGQAEIAMTLDTKAGTNTVEASAAGASSVTFSETGVAGAASQFVMVSGNNQTAHPADLLATPLVTSVQDQYGNGILGYNVTFSVTRGGADGAAVQEVQPVQTDAAGLATATLKVGSKVDRNDVEAGCNPALPGSPKVFSAYVVAGDATRIAMVSGDGQSKTVGATLDDPFVVSVSDAFDNAVENFPVTFLVIAGDANFSGEAETTVATGANGQAAAALTLGTAAGGVSVHAIGTGLSGSPVEFSATALPDVPDGGYPDAIDLDGGDGGTADDASHDAETTDGGGDAGMDTGTDAGTDAGDDAETTDTGADAGTTDDTSHPSDVSHPSDTSYDAGEDAGKGAGPDAGTTGDAGTKGRGDAERPAEDSGGAGLEAVGGGCSCSVI